MWRKTSDRRPTTTRRSGSSSRDGDEIAALLRVTDPGGSAAAASARSASAAPWRGRGLGAALLLHSFGEFRRAGATRVGLGVDSENATGATQLYERVGHARRAGEAVRLREGARMSRLRAQVPDCRTLTAVALGPELRVPLLRTRVRRRARPRAARLGRRRRGDGRGGARSRSPTRRSRSSRRTRSPSRRSRSPPRCPSARSCSAAAAARTSAPSRVSPPATTGSRVVWLDAHGDLNTPETSPCGNAWGMPLRMLLDAGAVRVRGRRSRRRAQPRPAGGGVHRRESAFARARKASTRRSTDATASTSRSTRRARRRARSSVVHARAGRADARRGRALLRRIVASARTVVGRRAHRPHCRAGNVEPLARLCAALGL